MPVLGEINLFRELIFFFRRLKSLETGSRHFPHHVVGGINRKNPVSPLPGELHEGAVEVIIKTPGLFPLHGFQEFLFS